MVEPTILAAAVQSSIDTAIIGKGLMIGGGFIGPAIGIGIIGGNYMQAVGRNPEAAKFLGQALIFTALAELFGLIAFASIFIVK
ncbi:MAG TPA: F0F1 ATP synthase subunit C [Candidatus Saccharimonadales bacterium]|nr:F0F1 ATP synthase subunit C [Candidatus Saccharimonadales bacterium]